MLVQGLFIGLAVAAPVGPMSVLCMRRTLVRGWAAGIGTGLGIACGDGIYGRLAVLGLAGVTRFMLAYDRELHAVAGVFLIIVAGVFVGSAAWWFSQTLTIASVRRAVGQRVRRRIDVVASTGLAAFGITELRLSL